MGKVILCIKTYMDTGRYRYAYREIESWPEAIHVGDACEYSIIFTVTTSEVTRVVHMFLQGIRIVHLEDISNDHFDILLEKDSDNWKEECPY